MKQEIRAIAVAALLGGCMVPPPPLAPGAAPSPSATPSASVPAPRASNVSDSPSSVGTPPSSPVPSSSTSTSLSTAAPIAGFGTVSGVVIDDEYKDPKPKAKVTYYGKDGIELIGDVDADGRYTLRVPVGSGTVGASLAHHISPSGGAEVRITKDGESVTAAPITLQVQHWYPQLSGTDAELLDVYAVDGDHAWVAGRTGTLLRTTDGGDEWLPASRIVSQDLLTVFFVSPTQGWVGTAGGLVLGTSDGGQTWTETGKLDGGEVNDIQFLDDQTGWAVTSAALFATRDGGKSWVRNDGVAGKVVRFFNAERGVVAGSQLFITKSGGATWQEGARHPRGLTFLGLHMFSPSEIWTFDYYGTMKSTDGGLTQSEVESKVDGGVRAFRDLAKRLFVTRDNDGGLLERAMYFGSPRAGWAVGERGRILRY